MKLSIIVPVYNMAADGLLSFCLDSLLNQTITDYEIIAVNDASTDDSLSILKTYEKQFPEKVKVISYSVNKRQGGAKNEGLKIAGGEWIGFVDSDDWVSPDCYEKLLAKAQSTGADMVGCDYNLVSEHTFTPGKIIRNNTMEQTGVLDKEKHKMLLMRPGSMVIKIYKNEIIQQNNLRFPEGIFYEDNCAGSVWSLYFNHFEKVEEPLYFYYQHVASTVHHISMEKCMDRLSAADLLYEECEKRGFLKEYFPEIEYRYTELYYVITLFTYLQGVRHPKLSFAKSLREKTTEKFPDFARNPYYLQYKGAEEQKWIALQQKSDLSFWLQYRLRLFVRKLRSVKSEI